MVINVGYLKKLFYFAILPPENKNKNWDHMWLWGGGMVKSGK